MMIGFSDKKPVELNQMPTSKEQFIFEIRPAIYRRCIEHKTSRNPQLPTGFIHSHPRQKI